MQLKAVSIAWLALWFIGFNDVSGQQPASVWVGNLKEAQEAAERRHCLVYIHFSRQACQPCIRFERNVLSVPEVDKAIGTNYVAVRVDSTQFPQLAQRFRVELFPTDVFLTPDGQEVFRTVSPQDPVKFVGILDNIAAHARIARRPSESPNRGEAPYSSNEGYVNRTTDPQYAAQNPSDWRYEAQGRGAGRPAYREVESTDSRPPEMETQNSRFAPDVPATEDLFRSHRNYGDAKTQPGPFGDQYRGRPETYGVRQNANSAAESESHGASSSTVERNQAATSPGTADRGEEFIQNNTRAPRFSERQETPPSTPENPSTTPSANPIGLDGFCPVTVRDKREWKKGDPRWGAIHRGRTYLFAGHEEQQTFLNDPDLYSPLLSGYDPVVYLETGKLVEGKRAHGMYYGNANQIYLFSTEQSLNRFWNQKIEWANRIEQAMRSGAATKLR